MIKTSFTRLFHLFISSTWIFRGVLGSVFIISAALKIERPFDFLIAVYRYELVGGVLGMIVAAVLPWLEFVIGICLISGFLIEGASLAASILLLLFVIAQLTAVHRGLIISCGCFGSAAEELVSSATVARTCLILAIAIVLLIASVSSIRRAGLRN